MAKTLLHSHILYKFKVSEDWQSDFGLTWGSWRKLNMEGEKEEEVVIPGTATDLGLRTDEGQR